MAKKSALLVTPSSGNVFADLGFAEPEEELAKAQLASRIQGIVKLRLANFSSGRLMRLLTTLGQDVEIVIRASRAVVSADAFGSSKHMPEDGAVNSLETFGRRPGSCSLKLN
ncbi:MAG: hypothetical protein ABIS29_01520 [Vicinamibacterales bacterium]